MTTQIIESKSPLTFHDIRKIIPDRWKGAEVCIGTSIGGANRINRISLHENISGKKIVLLHTEELHTQKS